MVSGQKGSDSPLTNWKVAGYGWPGRGANAVSPRGMRVRLPHLPLDALVVKRTSRLASNEEVRVRFLAGVLVGDSPVVEWPRRLPDTEEIGGSIPPGTTAIRPIGPIGPIGPMHSTDGLPDSATGLAWRASEPQGLVGSTPTPSAG